jgi:hypothetical protein
MKLAAIFLILFGVLMRILPHPENFAPITAIALFGAVYLPKRFAFILPLGAMLISDLIIGFYGVTMIYVYGSFVISGLLGLLIRKKKSIKTVVSVSLISSLLFFLITNFGVWANPKSWYTPNLSGLLDSYIAGIPFFRGTMFGDLVYTAGFFSIYEFVRILGKKFLPSNLLRIIF